MKFKRLIVNLLTGLILVLNPLIFAVSVTLAAPQTPSLPSSPSTPDSPDQPEDPDLPGDEENVGSTTQSSSEASPENTSSNTGTGADSTNNSSTSSSDTTNADINNDATIDNLASVDATSGENDANKNTGDGSVVSGDALVNGSVETSANNINLGTLECSTECGVVSLTSLESGNSTTGANSDNTSSSSANNDQTLGINNSADVNNLVMFDANSGDNSASMNTGNGMVVSGDAEIILTAINAANNINVGYEAFNIYDDQTGDLVIDFDQIAQSPYIGLGSGSASNTTTGADSTNTSTTDTSNNTQILIDNDGNVINNYYLDANTGDNTADKNTGDGLVTTGDANVAFNLINFLNNVFLGSGGQLLLGVVNIFGTLNGDIVLQGLGGGSGGTYDAGSLTASNSTTGADSTNDAATNLTNDTDINLANSANVLNNVSLDASTGNNTTDKNTGSGVVNTGDTDANLKVTNIANTTTIGDGGTIWMVLVNNLGTWTGQLFDTNSSTGAYSPFFTFSLSPDGSLSASNNTTGAGSSNDASSTVANDTDVSISNNATVTNNVMIDANTGGNSASKNTGSGTINTGDVNVSANIVNLINNIFLGGRFAITIVNIFGGFLGDIRQGSVGTINVGPNESIAISPNGVQHGSNAAFGSNNQAFIFGSGNGDSADLASQDDTTASVIGTNSGPDDSLVSPIVRFGADPGLFDNFKLMYLLLPVFFGSLVVIIRRAFR